MQKLSKDVCIVQFENVLFPFSFLNESYINGLYNFLNKPSSLYLFKNVDELSKQFLENVHEKYVHVYIKSQLKQKELDCCLRFTPTLASFIHESKIKIFMKENFAKIQPVFLNLGEKNFKLVTKDYKNLSDQWKEKVIVEQIVLDVLCIPSFLQSLKRPVEISSLVFYGSLCRKEMDILKYLQIYCPIRILKMIDIRVGKLYDTNKDRINDSPSPSYICIQIRKLLNIIQKMHNYRNNTHIKYVLIKGIISHEHWPKGKYSNLVHDKSKTSKIKSLLQISSINFRERYKSQLFVV